MSMLKKQSATNKTGKKPGRKPALEDTDFFNIVKDYKVLGENNNILPLSHPVWDEIASHKDVVNKIVKSTIYKRVYDDWKKKDSKLKNYKFGGYVEKAPNETTEKKRECVISQNSGNKLKVDSLKELHRLKRDANYTMAIKDINIYKFSVHNFSPEELDAWKCSCELGLTFVLTSGKYTFENLEVNIDANEKYVCDSIDELSFFSICENDALPLGSLLQQKVDHSDVNDFLLEILRHMKTIYFPSVIFVKHFKEIREGLSLALYNKTCDEYINMCLDNLEKGIDTSEFIKTAIKIDIKSVVQHFITSNYFKNEDHQNFYTKSIILLSQCGNLTDFKELLQSILVTAGTECITTVNEKAIHSLEQKIKDIHLKDYLGNDGHDIACLTSSSEKISTDSLIFILIDQILTNSKKQWVKALSHEKDVLNNNYASNKIIESLKTLCLDCVFWSNIVNPKMYCDKPTTNFYSNFNNSAQIYQTTKNEISSFVVKFIIFKQEVLMQKRAMLDLKPRNRVKKSQLMSNKRYILEENWQGLIKKATKPFDEFCDPEEADDDEIEKLCQEKSCEEEQLQCDSGNIVILLDETGRVLGSLPEIAITSEPLSYENKGMVYCNANDVDKNILDPEKDCHDRIEKNFENSCTTRKSMCTFVNDYKYKDLQEISQEQHDSNKYLDSSLIDKVCQESEQIQQKQYDSPNKSFESSITDDSCKEDEQHSKNFEAEQASTERVHMNHSSDSNDSFELYSTAFKWDQRNLIRNGLKLPPTEYKGLMWKLINTCPLDSLVEALVACSCFMNSFGNFVSKTILEGSKTEIFSILHRYRRSDFLMEVYYQMRFEFCLNNKKYKKTDRIEYLEINCEDSIDALYEYLFKDDCPITKITACNTCGYSNIQSITAHYLKTSFVEVDPSLSTMKKYLESKYSRHKKSCHNEHCNSSCTVNYELKEWFCVHVETSYLMHGNAYATLSKIPSSLTLKKEEYILTGLVAFIPPIIEKGIAHYYCYNRFTNGEWEERDNLVRKICNYTKKTKKKLKPALLLYIRKNVNGPFFQ